MSKSEKAARYEGEHHQTDVIVWVSLLERGEEHVSKDESHLEKVDETHYVQRGKHQDGWKPHERSCCIVHDSSVHHDKHDQKHAQKVYREE